MVADKYEEHLLEFLNFFGTFTYIWDRHLRHIMTAKHRIELTDVNVRPVRSVPYRAGPMARQTVATEIDMTL